MRPDGVERVGKTTPVAGHTAAPAGSVCDALQNEERFGHTQEVLLALQLPESPTEIQNELEIDMYLEIGGHWQTAVTLHARTLFVGVRGS